MTHVSQLMPGRRDPTPPMVGRVAERVLLSEQLSAARAGRGNVVIIGGEAGIGKTTIARDLVEQARSRSFLTLTGHCYDLMAAPPYGLWLDLADRYANATGAADLPPLPTELVLRDLSAITNQSVLFSTVADFLRAIANAYPAVIVLEDVHWADPASLELLRHVASRIGDLRLLLVVTYREDELTRQNPFYQQLPALIRESDGLRLDLKRLAGEELDALVKLHFPLPDADRARLVAYLERHADGNPFFVMELLRALEEQEEGGLALTQDGWSLGELDRLVVPPLVRQVIDARVARLGETTRTPLTVSAVIGHDISLDLLATLTGSPTDEVDTILDRAIEWHLLAATPDGSGVQFVHALTREALYASIPPHRRRALHTAVAEALERRPHPDADTIAYHYQQAGDERAPSWLIRAGERAQRAYAWLTARQRFESAADLLEPVPGEESTRARLLYRCGRLLRYSDAPAAIDHLRVAAHLATVAGDQVLAADATYSRGLVRCFADQWLEGLADMIHGIELLHKLHPRQAYVSSSVATWMADALPIVTSGTPKDDTSGGSLTAIGPARHRSLPWFLAASGRLQEARQLAESFVDDLAGTNTGPLALANLAHSEFGHGTALAALGEPDEASKAFDRARDSYHHLDHHAVLAFVELTELLDVHIPFRTDDVEGCRRLAGAAERSIERARGAIPAEVLPNRAHLPVMLLDGRWDEARSIAAACRLHGTYVLRRPVTLALASIAAYQGDADEAWSQIHSLLPRGPGADPGSALLADALMLQRLAVRLALDVRDIELARQWLHANDRWLAWSGAAAGRAGNALAWGQFHHLQGDLGKAEERVNHAIKAASAPRQPLVLIEAHRIRGELAQQAGETGTASGELTLSMALATSCGLPFEQAQTLLALARLQSGTDRGAAMQLADDALGTAHSLGAQPLIARVKRFLDEEERHSTRPGSSMGLTDREMDVLGLVCQGMTDAEVGAVLSISSRTVSQHLRSVYGKLGVRSRLEAARFAIDHGLI